MKYWFYCSKMHFVNSLNRTWHWSTTAILYFVESINQSFIHSKCRQNLWSPRLMTEKFCFWWPLQCYVYFLLLSWNNNYGWMANLGIKVNVSFLLSLCFSLNKMDVQNPILFYFPNCFVWKCDWFSVRTFTLLFNFL